MRDRIFELEKQHLVDEELIDHLEAEATIGRGKIAHLELALKSARCIGAAMGVLLERHKVTDVESFAMLARASQRANLKLREIAEQLVLTGNLPD